MNKLSIRDHRSGKFKGVIEIRGVDGGYSFHPDDKLEIVCEMECDCCFNIVLDPYYVYIVSKLIDDKLIPESYPFLCCYCKVVFDNLSDGDYQSFSNTVWVKYMTFGESDTLFEKWFSRINSSINLDLIPILKENLSEEKWKEISKIL